jgi:hypothetical protein
VFFNSTIQPSFLVSSRKKLLTWGFSSIM